MTGATLTRQALDELLRRYPVLDVLGVDWQLPRELFSASVPQRRWSTEMVGPWVLVQLGLAGEDPLDFAIWKHTGALYLVGTDGAVGDDPIWEPGGAGDASS